MQETDKMEVHDDELLIRNEEQYKRYLEKYKCSNHVEFEETLYYTYGITVIYNDHMESVVKQECV